MNTTNPRTKWPELGATVGRSAARPPKHDRRLEDLASASGPPLTTRQLAQMIGMSATFVRDEIRSGHLRAVLLGRGRKRVFRIPVHEARRYAKELGLI
jgi:hypothetical protein